MADTLMAMGLLGVYFVAIFWAAFMLAKWL